MAAEFGVLAALAAVQQGDARQLSEGLQQLSASSRSALLTQPAGGASLLHWAAEGGHDELVRLLVGYGHVVDAPESQGATPLMWAAGEGHAGVVRQLLEHGASPTAVDVFAETPLHWAALNGHAEAARLVIDAGVKYNHRAAAAGDVFLVDAKNSSGATPLHHATVNKHAATVRLLIDAGADAHTSNSQGDTPLSLAEKLADPALLRCFDAESRGLLAELDRQQQRAAAAEQREQQARDAHAHAQIELAKTQAMLEVAATQLADERAAHAASKGLLADMRAVADQLEAKLDGLVGSLEQLRADKKRLEAELAAAKQQQQATVVVAPPATSASSVDPAMMRKLVDLQQALGQCAMHIALVQQDYFTAGQS